MNREQKKPNTLKILPAVVFSSTGQEEEVQKQSPLERQKKKVIIKKPQLLFYKPII